MMKTILSIGFALLLDNMALAQDSQLFQFDWKLESLTTIDTIMNMPTGMHYNAKFFPESNASFLYQFGFCHHLDGDINYPSLDMFTISSSGGLLEPCEEQYDQYILEDYIHDEFVFDQWFVTPHNPFSYSFTYDNNLIYLHITNNEGSIATFYDNFLSLEEFLQDQITVYPNPAYDKLHFNSSTMAIDQVHIFDITGRLIKDVKQDFNQPVDVSFLTKGIYLLSIETPIGIVKKKMIKK